MELHPGACYILFLTRLSITIGFDISKKSDNESEELHDRSVHLFFILISFKTLNIENYSQ